MAILIDIRNALWCKGLNALIYCDSSDHSHDAIKNGIDVAGQTRTVLFRHTGYLGKTDEAHDVFQELDDDMTTQYNAWYFFNNEHNIFLFYVCSMKGTMNLDYFRDRYELWLERQNAVV